MAAILALASGAPGDARRPMDSAAFASRVAELVNRERRGEGLDPLKADPLLASAARLHAEDMAVRGYFDHSTPEGLKFGFWGQKAGYQGFCAAENIAMGARTPDDAVALWMASAPHRKAILRPDLDELGAGFAGSRAISVLTFGRSGRPFRVVIADEAASCGRTAEVFVGPLAPGSRMRLREAGKAWTDWRPGASYVRWTFDGPPGPRTLEAEVEGAGTARDDVRVQAEASGAERADSPA